MDALIIASVHGRDTLSVLREVMIVLLSNRQKRIESLREAMSECSEPSEGIIVVAFIEENGAPSSLWNTRMQADCIVIKTLDK